MLLPRCNHLLVYIYILHFTPFMKIPLSQYFCENFCINILTESAAPCLPVFEGHLDNALNNRLQLLASPEVVRQPEMMVLSNSTILFCPKQCYKQTSICKHMPTVYLNFSECISCKLHLYLLRKSQIFSV